jgi:hypothetical protein
MRRNGYHWLQTPLFIRRADATCLHDLLATLYGHCRGLSQSVFCLPRSGRVPRVGSVGVNTDAKSEPDGGFGGFALSLTVAWRRQLRLCPGQ